MNVDSILQIAGVGILVAVIFSVLKQAGRDDMAWLVSLGGVIVVLWTVIRLINDLFQTVRTMFLF
ncbi:MAG: stage III sporulation protein AC [Clostridia bacterium]|nr:stage III sporulation protein AC [Clostridia bacterium]